METVVAQLLIVMGLMAAPATAADGPTREPTSAQLAQRERMTQCNKEAGDRKGEARQKFMASCLKEDASPRQLAQRERMRECNKEAGNMKGDERKKFMSSCLSDHTSMHPASNSHSARG